MMIKKMTNYQRIALNYYFSSLKVLKSDMNYIIGFDIQTGGTILTADSLKERFTITTEESTDDVKIIITDLDEPKTKIKRLKVYGDIQFIYNSSEKIYNILQSTLTLLEPKVVFQSSISSIINTVFTNKNINIIDIDYMGKKYQFVTSVKLLIEGLRDLEDEIMIGVVGKKMTLIGWIKTDEKNAQEEIQSKIIGKNGYKVFDSIQLA